MRTRDVLRANKAKQTDAMNRIVRAAEGWYRVAASVEVKAIPPDTYDRYCVAAQKLCRALEVLKALRGAARGK